jgi:hypothetical protein
LTKSTGVEKVNYLIHVSARVSPVLLLSQWIGFNCTLGMKKMRYIFDTPEMPKICIIREKKGRKSSKIGNNNHVSHQYGKKNLL